MIEFQLTNFKAFAGPETIPIRPITLIFGPNSSGKSAILQSLLMLKQSIKEQINEQDMDVYEEDWNTLSPQGYLVNLGSFGEFIYCNNKDKLFEAKLSFSTELILKEYSQSLGMLAKTIEHNNFKELGLKVSFAFNKLKNRIDTDKIELYIGNDINPILSYMQGKPNVMHYKIDDALWAFYGAHKNESTYHINKNVYSNHDYWKHYFVNVTTDLSNMICNIFKNYYFDNIISNELIHWSEEVYIFIKENIIKNDIIQDMFYANIIKDSSIFTLDELKSLFVSIGILLYNTVHNFDTEFVPTNEFHYKLINYINQSNDNILDNILINRFEYVMLFGHKEVWNLTKGINLFNEKVKNTNEYLLENYFLYIQEMINYVEERNIILESINEIANNNSFGDESSKYDTIYNINLLCFQIEYRKETMQLYKYLPYDINYNYNYQSLDKYSSLPISVFTMILSKLIRNFMYNIVYIGPLRDYPEKYYTYIGSNTKYVGKSGSFMHEILIEDNEKNGKIEKIINKWFDKLGIKYELKVFPLHNEEANISNLYALRLLDKAKGINVGIADVGFGISQIMPIIIQSVISEKKTLILEQPELHLHPRMQAELGDLFIEAALGEKTPYGCIKRDNSFIIETHSEHLILRILRRIRETTDNELPEGLTPITPDQVAVLYVEPTENGSKVIHLPITEDGEFSQPWPEGFFEERAQELF